MKKINEAAMRTINGGDNVQEVIIGGPVVARNFVLVQRQNVFTTVNVRVVTIRKFR